MQAKQADGTRRSVCDVLEYLITIHEVKDAIKKDGSKIKRKDFRITPYIYYACRIINYVCAPLF